MLGLHLQRSFHSLKLDTCLTCNTNIAPEKNLNWPPVQSQLPALQGSRYHTCLLFFRMPVPPSAHHMKPNESSFVLNQGEQGNTEMTTWSLTCIFLSLKQHLTEPFPLVCITVLVCQVMPQAGQKPLSPPACKTRAVLKEPCHSQQPAFSLVAVSSSDFYLLLQGELPQPPELPLMSFPCPSPTGSSGLLLVGLRANFTGPPGGPLLPRLASVFPLAFPARSWVQARSRGQAVRQRGCSALT